MLQCVLPKDVIELKKNEEIVFDNKPLVIVALLRHRVAPPNIPASPSCHRGDGTARPSHPSGGLPHS